MKYSTRINIYILSFLFMLIVLFLGAGPVLGARLAGEDGVISVTPTPSQPVKKVVPVKPEKEKRKPKAQLKVPAEERITQKKKLPVTQKPDNRYVTIDLTM